MRLPGILFKRVTKSLMLKKRKNKIGLFVLSKATCFVLRLGNGTQIMQEIVMPLKCETGVDLVKVDVGINKVKFQYYEKDNHYVFCLGDCCHGLLSRKT